MRIIFIFFISVLLFNSCCKRNQPTENISTLENVTETIPKLIVNKDLKEQKASAFDITNLSIEGDILIIDVSYSGGCKEHEFNLYFDGNYMKSLPPKANLKLHHVYVEDECRSIVEKKLKFDISPAQYEGQKEIKLQVTGSTNEIRYSY